VAAVGEEAAAVAVAQPREAVRRGVVRQRVEAVVVEAVEPLQAVRRQQPRRVVAGPRRPEDVAARPRRRPLRPSPGRVTSTDTR
jgi:hypothetical protein